MLRDGDGLADLRDEIEALRPVIAEEEPQQVVDAVAKVERAVGGIAGASSIRSKLAAARREFRESPNRAEAAALLNEALEMVDAEVAWRQTANAQIGGDLTAYEEAIRDSIGLRQQQRMGKDLSLDVAACMSHHRDISLDF